MAGTAERCVRRRKIEEVSPMTTPATPSAGSGRHLRRRLAVVIGLVAIVAILAVELPQLIWPAAPTSTVWQEITSGITDSGVPKQAALEAFAYLYQVDIPGVTVPAGIEGGDEPSDGSGALAWVQAVWSQLTPAQQAAIDPYLEPGATDTTVTLNPSPTPTGSSGASGEVRPGSLLADELPAAPLVVDAPSDAPADLTTAMENELEADIVHIGPRLGMPVLPLGSPFHPNIELTLSNMSGGKTLFQTAAIEDGGDYEPCHVTAFKNAWEGQKVTTTGGVSPELHVLMTHEVVHCYQNVIWGSVATHLAIPAWITEGTALWLAADDTGIAEPMIPSMWERGYFIPETPLTNRSYDAFGYYALLDQQGRPLWSLMKAAWEAAAASSTRSDAFIAVLSGDAPDIRDNWAESYVRKTSWGDPWIAYGFGLPAAAQVVEHPAQANAAPGWTGTLPSRSNTVLDVDSSTGEVVTVTTDGLASVHDDAGHHDLAFKSQRFCTVASCVCPKGTRLAGDDMASEQLTIPFVAAFNAPEGGSSYSVLALTLAELCGLNTPPPAISTSVPGPCATGCADTNGDPHLLTVNNVAYDFQAAGEFTLLRSRDGSVDIQARQEPFGDGGDITTNTAIAARVGSHRVGVYLTPDSTLEAHVDGQVVNLGSGPMDLGNGGSLAAYDSASTEGFAIVFPDGTKLWALSVADWGIDAQILPSASLRASGAGLLGPAASGLGVPALPDGTALASPADSTQQYDLLYNQFADAWRITDSTSLFDYDPGKSTETYTIKPYPVDGRSITLADLTPAQLAAGEAACRSITNPVLHDDCVLDVGITGDAGFAATYTAVEAFDAAGLAPVAFPSALASSGPSPAASVSGAVTVAGGTKIGGYAVGPDDTVYASIQTGPKAYGLVSFDPRTGKVLNQVAVPATTEVHYAAGSLWLPGLETGAGGGNCSVTRFDASTLSEQATIKIPCADVLGPIVASDGSALWYEDTSKVDVATGLGAVARRIDPATNEPADSVAMPPSGGYLIDSGGAIFYADPDTNAYYVLDTTASQAPTFAPLGNFPEAAVASGSGLWTQDGQGKPAEYYTHAGSPDRTISIHGTLVGGDANAVYVEGPSATAAGGSQPALLRYGVDGSPSTRLALPPKVGGKTLSYQGEPGPTVTQDGLVDLWIARANGQSSLISQWVPLP